MPDLRTREPQAAVVRIPAHRWPGPLLNVNMARGHTRHLSHRIPPWRAVGREAGRRLPRMAGPVRIWLEVRFATNHRRDAANLYPTAKALVDGLVDAGTLPGDHDGVLEGPWIHRVYPNGPELLTLVVEPLDADSLGRSRDHDARYPGHP